MEQLTKEQAIAFAESKTYETMTFQQIAEFQMLQQYLCMPFSVFHESLEKALGRPVWTHELGMNHEGLMGELFLGNWTQRFIAHDSQVKG